MRYLALASAVAWLCWFGVQAHKGGDHHHHDSDEWMLYGSFREIVHVFSEYDYKIQAIIATFIVQSVPVFLMSWLYPFLKIYVKDADNSNLLMAMYSFTFGSLMGDVFFHILPSVYEHTLATQGKLNYDNQFYTNGFMILGVVLCYLLEIIIHNYFHHSHGSHGSHWVEKDDDSFDVDVKKSKNSKKANKAKNSRNTADLKQKSEDAEKVSTIAVALLGDFFHNFTDGLAIASTFTLSTKLGLVTTIAWFVHEIPHEIGDFAYAFKNGYTYWQALGCQLLTGCGAMLGCVVSLIFSKNATIEMVALSGGTFLYMSLCLFLEDMRKTKSVVAAIVNIGFIGIGLMSMHFVAKIE